MSLESDLVALLKRLKARPGDPDPTSSPTTAVLPFLPLPGCSERTRHRAEEDPTLPATDERQSRGLQQDAPGEWAYLHKCTVCSQRTDRRDRARSERGRHPGPVRRELCRATTTRRRHLRSTERIGDELVPGAQRLRLLPLPSFHWAGPYAALTNGLSASEVALGTVAPTVG